MMMPLVVGTVVTSKIVQAVFITTMASKLRKSKHKRKAVDQSWKLTQFLEESRFVK